MTERLCHDGEARDLICSAIHCIGHAQGVSCIAGVSLSKIGRGDEHVEGRVAPVGSDLCFAAKAPHPKIPQPRLARYLRVGTGLPANMARRFAVTLARKMAIHDCI